MKAKIIVFDFDGVLVDSVGLKNQAFEEIYMEYFGELTPDLRQYLESQGGLERAKKFTHFYQTTEGRSPTETELEFLSKLFTQKVKATMIERALMQDVLKVLETLKKQKLLLYIASGAPHEELRDICKQIGINQYFIDIFGSPHSKASVITHAAASHGISHAEIIMIGDSMTDWNAAQKTKCKFLGVKSKYTTFPEGTEICETIELILSKV